MADIIGSPKALAAVLRAARMCLKRRQRDAAAMANISRQHLSEIENGKAVNLELPTLLRLLSSYGLVLTITPVGPRPNLNDVLQAIDEGRDYFEALSSGLSTL
jgi:transcriptional regulator with XRE-family HTH domain